jgi:hypothetical protein
MMYSGAGSGSSSRPAVLEQKLAEQLLEILGRRGEPV